PKLAQPAKPTPAEATPVETPQQKAETAALQAKVEAAAQPDAAGKATAEPKVEVRRTAEGLVIGLTDDADFTMFASASAEPSPQAVALMARIGKLLKDKKGGVTIRGFTDSRPFRSDAYDNWRLSSARADMAHYMLVRGGLDDARIDRIEGYADRRPKTPKNPAGPENRRIEILLREPTP
ncbi:OmpA family protein, partial [Lichenihabitans sp. Uapishka_5]|uniref:OmpA family protein n=1 Tax=Lichenihabitans sp. Uapishka_5 TaxID=3037302 RepID=UPI0029E81B32